MPRGKPETHKTKMTTLIFDAMTRTRDAAMTAHDANSAHAHYGGGYCKARS